MRERKCRGFRRRRATDFHNGSRLTLAQVVEFYDRGGDRRGPDGNDSTGLVAADGVPDKHCLRNDDGSVVPKQ